MWLWTSKTFHAATGCSSLTVVISFPFKIFISDAHFFPPALVAALVTLESFDFFVTSLMTPTATVCLMSRTAKRPRGGYSENVSTLATAISAERAKNKDNIPHWF